MHAKISPAAINDLSATMLIPLWAKAIEYDRPDALLRDAQAKRMMGRSRAQAWLGHQAYRVAMGTCRNAAACRAQRCMPSAPVMDG